MLGFVIENMSRYLHGGLVTIEIATLTCVIGFFLAIPLALMRLSSRWIVYTVSTGYVFFFRGTPLLAQIFLIYYGSGQFKWLLEDVGLWGLFRDPWYCALLTLSLNMAAYTSEVVRGAIQSVPKGEIEAATTLGLKTFQRFWLIVLPRAIGIAWPAYANEVVYQIQATSLVSIITIMDITGVARSIGARNFTFYEAFIVAGAMYLMLVYGFLFVARRVENRFNAHLKTDTFKRQPTLAGFAK